MKFLVTKDPWDDGGRQETVTAETWHVLAGSLIFYGPDGNVVAYAPGHWGHFCKADE